MVRWPRLIPVVAAVAVIGTGAALGFIERPGAASPRGIVVVDGDGSRQVEGEWPATPKETHPLSYTVADAAGPSVDLFSAPDVPLAERTSMANPTWEGLPVVFLVDEEQGDWLRVHVSMRPNGFMAWVKRSQVKLRTVPNRIVVDVTTRRVEVFHGDDRILDAAAAIGAGRTPTPIGLFFVDGWVPLEGNGPYGAGQLSVSGFSEVLHSFGGGVGQIAIHGTNRPELMGEAVSNGCIRTENDVVLQLAMLAPLGTPVEIVS